MKRILTYEELLEIARFDFRDQLVEVDLLRAIEQAILEKIGNPVARLEGNPEGLWFVAYNQNPNAPQRPLYAIPFIEGDE